MTNIEIRVTRDDIDTADTADTTRDAVAQATARALQGTDLQGLRVQTGDSTVHITTPFDPEDAGEWFDTNNIMADAMMSPGVQEWVDHYRKAVESLGPQRDEFLRNVEAIALLLNTDAREMTLQEENPSDWR